MIYQFTFFNYEVNFAGFITNMCFWLNFINQRKIKSALTKKTLISHLAFAAVIRPRFKIRNNISYTVYNARPRVFMREIHPSIQAAKSRLIPAKIRYTSVYER